ncbi:MAG: DUF3137 domain-containing protein [Chloroflexales bacterium]|nr:DUF3137 domain-containing protein [Chloroflexales bacterium]
MPTDTQTLTNLYATELQPILGKLEQRRKQVCQRVIIFVAVFLPATLGLIVLTPHWTELLFALVFGLIAWRFFVNAALKEYRSFFKSEVITRLAYAVDPDLIYVQDHGIDRAAFRDSGIYRQGIDRYAAADLFRGYVGATAFRFSEVHAEYKTVTTDSKGRQNTHWHTIFRGIFFIADFNKHFYGQTFVLPDKAERAFGGFGRMLQDWVSKLDDRPGDLVHLEDPEFEQAFAVVSTDQVEARYILSTSLMQRLLSFRAQLGMPVAISFVNSNMYIAISTRKNYFEPPSIWRMGSELTQDDIASYFEDLRLAEDIVADLKLNTRIWSKQ